MRGIRQRSLLFDLGTKTTMEACHNEKKSPCLKMLL